MNKALRLRNAVTEFSDHGIKSYWKIDCKDNEDEVADGALGGGEGNAACDADALGNGQVIGEVALQGMLLSPTTGHAASNRGTR